ncbi:hypothetical protein EAI_09122 [Harpegnathos saltator]|uniref:Uncharacterized protein n=1 Tax=Harpegnathos saltator TaxID=610380 RepID=E2B5L1_HARSA|nr:hypothetical protein EAI_09122 [Harpegnathos saltator]
MKNTQHLAEIMTDSRRQIRSGWKEYSKFLRWKKKDYVRHELDAVTSSGVSSTVRALEVEVVQVEVEVEVEVVVVVGVVVVVQEKGGKEQGAGTAYDTVLLKRTANEGPPPRRYEYLYEYLYLPQLPRERSNVRRQQRNPLAMALVVKPQLPPSEPPLIISSWQLRVHLVSPVLAEPIRGAESRVLSPVNPLSVSPLLPPNPWTIDSGPGSAGGGGGSGGGGGGGGGGGVGSGIPRAGARSVVAPHRAVGHLAIVIKIPDKMWLVLSAEGFSSDFPGMQQQHTVAWDRSWPPRGHDDTAIRCYEGTLVRAEGYDVGFSENRAALAASPRSSTRSVEVSAWSSKARVVIGEHCATCLRCHRLDHDRSDVLTVSRTEPIYSSRILQIEYCDKQILNNPIEIVSLRMPSQFLRHAANNITPKATADVPVDAPESSASGTSGRFTCGRIDISPKEK